MITARYPCWILCVALLAVVGCTDAPATDSPTIKSGSPTIKSGGTASGDAITYRLKLAKGDVFKQQSVMEQTITQELFGNQQTMQQTVTQVIQYTVTAVDAKSVYSMDAEYTRIGCEMSGALGTVKYDSATDAQVPANAKAFAAMVGARFALKMDQSGTVLAVTGTESMLDSAMKGFAGGVPTQMRDQLRGTLEQQFGGESQKQSLQLVMPAFPEQAVGIGSVWGKTYEGSGPMPIRTDSTWTLHSREAGISHIGLDSKLSSDKGKVVHVMATEARYDLVGTQKGSIELVEKNGWVRASQVTQKMSGTVTMNFPTGEQAMHMGMLSTATHKLLE